MKAAKLEPNSESVTFPDWGEMFKFSFSGFFRNFWPFFGIALLINLSTSIIDFLVENYLMFDGVMYMGHGVDLVFYLILGVLSMLLLGIVGAIAWPFFAINISKGKRVGFLEGLVFAFKNFWKAISLWFRTFWYVFKWPLVAALVAVLVYFLTVLIGDVGYYGAEATTVNTTSVSEFGKAQIAGAVLAMLTTSGFLIIFIYFAIVRSLRAIFGFFALADGATPKRSLEISIAAVKGNWWKTLGYYFSMSILVGLIFIIPFMILTYALGAVVFESLYSGAFYLWETVFIAIAMAFITPVFHLFLAQMYLYLKKAKALK